MGFRPSDFGKFQRGRIRAFVACQTGSLTRKQLALLAEMALVPAEESDTGALAESPD